MADFGSQDDFFTQVNGWPSVLQRQSVESCSNTPASLFSQNSDGSTDDLLERTDDHDPDNELRLSYSIEWRISHNGKKLPKDTESNVTCTLETYWADVMKSKVEKYAAKKLASYGNCHVEDTNVTMCVAHRSVRLQILLLFGIELLTIIFGHVIMLFKHMARLNSCDESPEMMRLHPIMLLIQQYGPR